MVLNFTHKAVIFITTTLTRMFGFLPFPIYTLNATNLYYCGMIRNHPLAKIVCSILTNNNVRD